MDQDSSRFSFLSVLRGSRIASAVILAGGLVLLSACNAITGAGDLRLVDEEEEDNSSGGHVLTGGPTGGGTTSAASSSSGGMTACTYPEGVYGKKVGDIVNPSLTWDGYPAGSSEVSKISIKDYFDCDGKMGINALLIIESAEWCPACQTEASGLNSKMKNGWQAAGIRVLTLVIEKNETDMQGHYLKATTETALKWKNAYGLETTDVVADPAFSFAVFDAGGVSLPLILVVDPRTMSIVYTQEGSSGSYPELEQLAEKNATP